MTKYIALLRGISPSNPNMRNKKLRAVFESLGFSNVQTIISSGNVIFTSPSKNTVDLEEKMVLIDKKYNKEVTTRTWKTVQRIVAKMNT